MTRRERNRSRKSAKRALAGSVLAIVLCVVLLAGATFAWFTDTASTKVSAIQSGTLKIKLEQSTDGGVNWNEVKDTDTLNFIKAEGHTDETVRWEPGATYELPTLRVSNTGSLALKYKVVFTPVVSRANKGGEKLADVLDVKVKNGTDWVTVGTLSDIMNAEDDDIDHVLQGELAAGGISGDYTVALSMKTSAGNEYQGLTIDGVTVTVLATQNTVEYDSNSNTYDAAATFAENVTTAEQLQTALKNNTAGAVALTGDLALTGDNTTGYVFYCKENLVIDANGRTVTNSTTLDTATGLEDNYLFYIYKDGNVTFTGDGTFKHTPNSGITNGLIYAGGNSTVTIKSGTFDTSTDGYAVWAYGSATVNIEGGTFTGSTGNKSEGDLIYANQNATINISGGFFDYSNSRLSNTLNILDKDRQTAHIVVTGGTFVNFDPSSMNTEDGSFVKDGYKVVTEEQSNGDVWYTVVPESGT